MFKFSSKFILYSIGAVLFLWISYTQFIAPKETLKLIDYYNIDKVMHFLGGFFVAGMSTFYFKLSKVKIFLLVILLGVGWEIFEVLSIPDVRYFYSKFYAYWLSDTVGDIIFDMVGGSFYIVMYGSGKRGSGLNGCNEMITTHDKN